MAIPVAERLRRAYPGLSHSQIAERTGVNLKTISRFMGGGRPSVEACLRLAAAVGEHPSVWLLAAGYREQAEDLLLTCPLDGETAPADRVAHRLHSLLDEVIRAGLEEPARTALERIGSTVAPLKQHFELVVQRAGADKAALLVISQDRQTVCTYGFDPSQQIDFEAEGWRLFSVDQGRASLQLWVKGSTIDESLLKGTLLIWRSNLLGR